MARVLKCLLGELLFWYIVVAIPTDVRNDNSTVAYQVDPPNTVTNGKRLNGLLASKRGELHRNSSMDIDYIPVGLNTSDGLTKSTSIANLGGGF